MLDSYIRPVIDPPLNNFAKLLKQSSITATEITLLGFGLGLIACCFALIQSYSFAMVFIILNRICDGFDGAVARVKNENSDFGGYLDITLDFVIYGGFPFFMAVGMLDLNAFFAASFVLFSMITTGVSFLAYAIICSKRGMETSHQGKKSFYFSNGLMEGTETILFLILLCLFPNGFQAICFTFGALCLITTALRIRLAYHVFV